MKRPPIVVHDEVSSTNDLVLQAARDGAPHGTCVVADRQTSGRGRREIGGERRVWFSPGESNIYMSVLLRPAVEPARAAGLTLAAATGICEALRDRTGVDVWVKWPNDLYVGSRKVAGVLTEAVTEEGRLEAVVVGIGVNVNVCEDQVPEELETIMTSLRMAGAERFDRLVLIRAVRRAVLDSSASYAEKGFPAFMERLRTYDRTVDRPVSVLQDGTWVEATSRGIGDDGRLLVEIDGEEVRLGAGEVRFR